MEVDKKDPPTSFSPVTSKTVRISPKHFLNFSFTLISVLNFLLDLCKILRPYLVPVPNHLT